MQRVSVIITNFNYERFLQAAIESALAQDHPETDVIVVDDGSTDGSRRIIEEYAGRVEAILKENGGQASAFNDGFRAAQGDVIIFLDADDILLPDTAARVVQRFRQNPDLAIAHYRLELIDADGRKLGLFLPSSQTGLPNGDIRERILGNAPDIPYPPTSGNAFARRLLERILPMPKDSWEISADTYIVNLMALLGPVAGLKDVGGYYRVHGKNTYYVSTVNVERIREIIARTRLTNAKIAELAASLGVAPRVSHVPPASVTDLAQRLMSLRLEPELHPVRGDRRLALARSGIVTSLRRRDLSVLIRILYCGWFVAESIVPRSASRWLAERLFAAWQIGGLRRATTHES